LLTIESKYEFHNQIRRFLEVKEDFPVFLWFQKGDFVLTFILILGIIFSGFFIKYLKQSKRSFILFSIGVLISIFAIGIDTFHLDRIFKINENIGYVIEEVSELMAMLLFLNSFFSMFCFYFIGFLKNLKISKKIPE